MFTLHVSAYKAKGQRSKTTRKGKETKHAHKNMEINGNTTNKHKLETA
jgi:hypothetical protein